jgi:hypothetical protein
MRAQADLELRPILSTTSRQLSREEHLPLYVVWISNDLLQSKSGRAVPHTPDSPNQSRAERIQLDAAPLWVTNK